MKNFETKSPTMADKERKEEKRNKSDFFYKDKWFRQRALEEKIKNDVDFKAFHRG